MWQPWQPGPGLGFCSRPGAGEESRGPGSPQQYLALYGTIGKSVSAERLCYCWSLAPRISPITIPVIFFFL